MTTPIRLLMYAAWAAVAASAAAAQESYLGMCDASAAVALGRGYFVVADDESDVLRIYRRGTAMPVGNVDLIDYLRNRKPSGKNAEADMEGAAAIDHRIYWVTSHALKGKEGAADPHRRRFFATDIVAGGEPPTVKAAAGAPHESLLDDLLADPRFSLLAEAARRKPEQAGGLNIEGLAAAPDGGLLIGFRNPQPQGRALVVPLRNPREIIDSGAKPVFGDLIRLDLGGRGIRSLERVGSDVLIVAGPYGTAATSRVQPAFALFRWSGVAAQAPLFVSALDTGTFRPEALFFDAEARDLVLLSDDGDEQVGGVACKERSVPRDSKGFRARSIALPHPSSCARRNVQSSLAPVALARKHTSFRSSIGLAINPLPAFHWRCSTRSLPGSRELESTGHVSQAVHHKRMATQRCAGHFDHVAMVREEQDLPALGDLARPFRDRDRTTGPQSSLKP